MTPTLWGRWQSRWLLLATVGVLVSLPFALSYRGPGGPLIFFGVVGYVALFGLGWDVLYSYLQTLRWDHDWPAALQLAAGLVEAGFLAVLFKTIGLPGMDRAMPLGLFWLHYGLVWLASFTGAQTMMRVAFPRSRFRGGQWLGK